MVLLTRKAEFSAAHYYWNDAWSQQENEKVFGKCANRNGHGHNYTLEVTVAGEIDPVSGFVVDLKALKDVIEHEVIHFELRFQQPRTLQLRFGSGWRRKLVVLGCNVCGCMKCWICLPITVESDEGLFIQAVSHERFAPTPHGVVL
jgi:hypothetical protein